MVKTIIDKLDHVYGVDNPLPNNTPSGDYTIDLQTYEPQKFFAWDLEECSQLGGAVSGWEVRFNQMKRLGLIPPTFLNFLLANNYWNGTSFAFSVQFIAIQDGTSINGNVMQSGHRIITQIGLIPRSMLEWSVLDASKYATQEAALASYYSESNITPEMKALGQQFLTFIQEYQWGWLWNNPSVSCPISLIQQGLQTSPLAFAVPVNDATWNQSLVPYMGGTETQHCVSIYKVDEITNPSYPIYFTDQYQPWLKQFQSNYFFPCIIAFNFVLKPEPVTSVPQVSPPVYQLPSWITWFARLFK